MTGPEAGATAELTIDRIAYGGDGVGRVDGLVVFVPGAAAGDRLSVTITDREPRFARARIERIIEPGADRVEPRCPVYGICGGCRLQHITAEAGRRAKAAAVADAFARIAGRPLSDPPVCEATAAEWGYRHRIVLSWRLGADAAEVGFHALGAPGTIVPIAECPIARDPLSDSIPALAAALRAARDHASVASEGRLVVRALPGHPVQAGVFADTPTVARAISLSLASALGMQTTWGRWKGDGAPLALDPGAPRMAIRLRHHELDLRVGFDSFLQVDMDAAERLCEGVLDALGDVEATIVIDAYAGVGITACRLASRGARVTAIETHPGAAADLRANTARIDGPPVHVLEISASHMDWRRPGPDAIIVNPPRGGCARDVLRGIGRSGADRLIYVSCDPTTLARDIRRLGGRWQVGSVRVYDSFPQTAHVETIVRLDRRRA